MVPAAPSQVGGREDALLTSEALHDPRLRASGTRNSDQSRQLVLLLSESRTGGWTSNGRAQPLTHV